MGFLSGLFGGFSGGSGIGNSTASTSSTDNSINTVDNRAGGDGSIFGGNVTLNPGDVQNSTLNISTSDQGAILAGRDLALEALKFAGSAQTSSASQLSDLSAQAFGLANEARQSETSGAINNFLKFAAIVAVVGIGAWAYSQSRRSR